ncbi:hypothetical protein M413DRAFT_290162 [Hebeloma cylindrosporum]|uniref:Uncharacterized protein n=1 Tax=Hebeloma cylindrosporum TaxID=76867 RepID=A0A0C3BYB9_HEBCY|nr:hypothetical protein M413DRAFT_290162 [Hebeloma cylindrosporum h7]
MFLVIAVPPQRPSHATSAVRKATFPGIALRRVTLRVVAQATAVEVVLAPLSAISVARSDILLVGVLRQLLEEETTARSVVDLKRLGAFPFVVGRSWLTYIVCSLLAILAAV